MSLGRTLAEALRVIPDCVATGFIDMKVGTLLGLKTAESHSQEALELVAAATGEIFQGQNVAAIEQMFKKTRAVAADGRHFFQEIIILSDNLVHVFQRSTTNEDLVMVTVCRISADLGMVLDKSRSQLSLVEAAA